MRPAAALAALAVAVSWPLTAGAEPPVLSFPLDCTLGQDCFIQQYVDGDPGPGVRDYACGRRSYDGHKGTDIRVAHLGRITGDGVRVLAAAPGRVLAVRNWMPDIVQSDGTTSPDISGQECGNGVLIEHGDGWRSQYCHMRQNSVLVSAGQSVARGQPLGLVGLSGLTQFPHLHIKITEGGRLVDPFRPQENSACGEDQEQLWSQPIDYVPGGIMSLGFTETMLDFAAVRQGPAVIETLAADAKALAVWGFFHGLSQGDEIRISILMPDGSVLSQQNETIGRDRAEAYRLFGKRRKGSAWPRGVYLGTAELLRDGVTLDRKSTRVRID